METLPVFLRLAGKRAAVVGGGGGAARRVEALARAGAQATVFAATLDDEFRVLREGTAFQHVARDPTRADLEGCVVCYVATGDAGADARVAARVRGARALINVADQPDLCDFIAPSIVDRAPLVVAISTGGAAPMLARLLKARLESAIPSAAGRLAAFMGKSRALVAARLADSRARRRIWERVLEGPIAEMVLVDNEPAAEAALANEIERERQGAGGAPLGEVYLVGAGPGDPDLLTFRALRLMQKADVVLYDRLVSPDIVDLTRREAERIYVGKRRADHTLPQQEIGELLVRLAREGKRVLRLKGGDPFIFGRGGEEIETLADHKIPFQVCPGITAATACSAYAGIPLTHRDHAQTCVFATGHGKDGPIDLDWGALIRPNQTVAIYMGLGHIEELTLAFVAHGADPDLPAAIVDNGARANQRVVVGALRTIAAQARAAALRGPTIIIVGTVVGLRDKLNWFAASPARAEADARGADVRNEAPWEGRGDA
ncbi:MAG: siroheme synthase CysG [Roseiarcus sp.]|jgi:uroporphyrin-III C-methyltransferase/precorrin-2 dehydrogenase/sirohydrochlorin ferrochelatase